MMDVDGPQPTRNSPFIYFDVSDSFPWQHPRPEQIRLRRASMDDTLIFDILLTTGGVGDPYVLYPPESPETLRQLLDAIESSNYDSLKKDCLIYFLLKWHQDGRERTFQEQRCIPPQFVALADAYWYLDAGINVPRAVALLSDARLNRSYASKIIRAISLSPEAAPLIRRYVQTAKPLLVEPLDIEYYALALADHNVLHAWAFTRTFSEADATRTRVLRKIFEWIISPQPRPIALKQLITIPLSLFEEKILNEFIQKPPNIVPFSSIAVLQDLICIRLIQGGRYAEAIKLDRFFSSTTHQRNLKDTHNRSSMVQEVYNALSAVEKSLLDLELDSTSLPSQLPLSTKPASPETLRPPAKSTADGEGQTSSLSQSWEEVRVPESLVQKSTPLRDVQLPTPVPRHGGTTTPASFPIFPVNLGFKSNTPRKNLPVSASALSSARPATLFGTPNPIASLASGIKPPESTNFGSSGSPFVSASRRENAFYQPPVKSNGMKRAFEDEELGKSPDDGEASLNGKSPVIEVADGDDGYDAEPTTQDRRSDLVEESDDEDTGLQYSVFGAKKESLNRIVDSRKIAGRTRSHRLDEDDGMESREPEPSKKPIKTQSGRTRHAKQTTSTIPTVPSKPPSKKVKQAKEIARHIPGGLIEDEDDDEDGEDEDQVSSLPTRTSRSIRGGKGKAGSVGMMDESEGGVQIRRRSSRLSAAGSSGSVRAASLEFVAPKTKRTGRTSTATKKR